jgi:hypothetical protein
MTGMRFARARARRRHEYGENNIGENNIQSAIGFARGGVLAAPVHTGGGNNSKNRTTYLLGLAVGGYFRRGSAQGRRKYGMCESLQSAWLRGEGVISAGLGCTQREMRAIFEW